MSGGTSRKNHSEVGSSYIHFNYTPNQDKATPSLIGEVPAGVMLNQAPVFLGGQGGLVGPCRIGFGAVTAAGTIQRKDALKSGRIYLEPAVKLRSMPFTPGFYANIKRIVTLNLLYIANLTALMHWYKHVRSQFISDGFPKTLWLGLIQTLESSIGERVKRLVEVAEKMPESIDIYTSLSDEGEESPLVRQKKQLYEKRQELGQALPVYDNYPGNRLWKEEFVNIVQNRIGKSEDGYLTVIQGLTESEAETGTKWLRSIVDEMLEDMQNRLPLFK
jgi:UDP-N-acetylglucosamine/UDP-N-acetylgalactosamine diphosphorylase